MTEQCFTLSPDEDFIYFDVSLVEPEKKIPKIEDLTDWLSKNNFLNYYFYKESIDEILEKLQKEYSSRGINLVCISKKWSFRTSANLSNLMAQEKTVEKKLSKAAIETLAIIAYHQPVTRAEIEDIRGVTVSSGTIDTLLQMNWVKIKGRRKVPGNPIAYGTTEEFLVHFDLQSIKDLPDMQELKSMGLLDNNLPPDLYPENLLNNDDIEEIDDINSNKVDGEF